MKLHWSPRSPFVRKVMIAAHELGISGRLTLVRTVVRMAEPNADLLPDNPLGKIPTLLLEDGTAMFDSLTICDYFDSLAGGARLIPALGSERWQALTWHALGNGFLDLLILWRNERDKPVGKQTEGWLDSFAVKTQATLDHLEALAPTLGQAPFNIGLIAIGCALSYLDFRFADLGWRTSRPVLAAWHAEFAKRPSVIATEIVDA